MGAAVSTRSSFKEHEGARVIEEKLAGKTVVSTRVDRKDFFAIFNGFDFVLPSGGFATLPVNEFNRFLEHDEKAATNGHNTIAIRRPLMLLVLLCEPGESKQEARLKLLASCAARQRDAAGEPVLSKKEVATLWRELFAAMAIAGLSPQKLGEAEILEIIKAAWKQMTAAAAEAGGDAAKDEVTLQELKDWCQTDLGRRGMLTKMFSGNVRGTVAQMAIAEYKKRGGPERKFDGGRASMRFERALKKNGKTQMAAKRQDDNLRALRKKRRAAHGGNEKAVAMEVREQQRHRKRKLNAVATTNTLGDLVIQTGMDLKQLMGLREDFADMIGRNEGGAHFRRALAVFDVDGDGWIDFDEFILALKRMDKDDDPTKQLKFIFDMFDESRDGEVELWEVSDAIEDHRKDIADMAKYCRGLAASLDVNGDDKINITEFRQSLKKEKVFINFCYEGLAPVHPTTNACVKAIAEFRARMIDAEDAGARVGADTPRTSSFVAVAPALRPDGTVMKPKVSEESLEAAVKVLFDEILGSFDRFTSMDDLAVDAAYGHLEENWRLPPKDDAEDGDALIALRKSRPELQLDMKARMLFQLIQSGHEKHNPGAIHVDVLAEETVSVEQVTGHLDRMEEQLTNDMEYLLFSFDEWDKDHSGSVTQDELVEYVMAEPRVMRMLQCVFFL
ncbi:hypothetical protein JL721_8482 [Aureococcus anophagefferens]|nr:hypothetical protein JL721_8482 [Aureococcus anophagefferens]